MRIAGIILAAGSSSRMKPINKLLIDFNGSPILKTVIKTFKKTDLQPLIIVLGYQAYQIRNNVNTNAIQFVVNSKWKTGMASSIKSGIENLPLEIDGVMIILGDMPNIMPEDIQLLIKAFDNNKGRKIIYPSKDGRQGNPVIFPKRFFTNLMLLTGDKGAKSILSENNSIAVKTDSLGVLLDIDTEFDLSAIQSVGSNHDTA